MKACPAIGLLAERLGVPVAVWQARVGVGYLAPYLSRYERIDRGFNLLAGREIENATWPSSSPWPWATLMSSSGLGFLGLSGSVALRYTLALSFILLVLAYVKAEAKPSPRFTVAIGFLTVGISGLDVLAHRAAFSIYSIAGHAQAIFLFFSIVLAFWCREWIWIEKYSLAWNGRRTAILILLISFSLIGLRWMLGGPQGFTADENIYLFQSYHGFHDLRGMKIESWLEPFFRVRQTYIRDGFLNGQYPPGWPFVLRLLHLIGLSSIAGSLVCTASIIALTYWVRMLRGSWEVAAIAVCLAATPFAQFYFNTSYLSHGISTFFALTAAISALAASRSSGYKGAGFWFLAGALSRSWQLSARSQGYRERYFC